MIFYKSENTFLLPGLLWEIFLHLINSSKVAIKEGYGFYKRKISYVRANFIEWYLFRIFIGDITLIRNQNVKTITQP